MYALFIISDESQKRLPHATRRCFVCRWSHYRGEWNSLWRCSAFVHVSKPSLFGRWARNRPRVADRNHSDFMGFHPERGLLFITSGKYKSSLDLKGANRWYWWSNFRAGEDIEHFPRKLWTKVPQHDPPESKKRSMVTEEFYFDGYPQNKSPDSYVLSELKTRLVKERWLGKSCGAGSPVEKQIPINRLLHCRFWWASSCFQQSWKEDTAKYFLWKTLK